MAYLGHKPAVGENNSFRILDDISSFVLTFDGSSASVVGLSDETITITENNHRFITGQRVTYSNGGGGNITGLTNGQAYFIINHSKTQIKLASSASNALAGTAVNLTGLGTGSSHTLTLAFDGVNTKFDPTFGDGMHDTLIKRAAQLVISINGVIQQPHDTATPSTGFGVDSLGHIIFSTAPASTDIFWGHILATNTVTFDSSDNDVDTFTGNGSTTSFTLSKTPPDNRNILVTIDGVVQYPSDAANTRSYNVSENVMTFVAAPGLGTVIQVRHIGYAGIGAGGGGGVTGFYGRTGNVSLVSTDNIVANNATFNGNVSIAQTLTYEDVTDIDSVGLITARSGIKDQTLTAGHVVFAGTGGRLSGEADLFYDASNNRLGIGTNNPSHELDIESSSPVIELKDNDAGDSRLQIAQSGAQTFLDMDKGGLGSSSLRFRFAGQEKVRFTSGGNVAINTTTSQNSAHVQHYTSTTRHQSFQSTDGDLAIVSDNNSNPVVYIKGTGTADLLNLYDGSTEVFSVADGGVLTITGKGLIDNTSSTSDVGLRITNNATAAFSTSENLEGTTNRKLTPLMLRNGSTSANTETYLGFDAGNTSKAQWNIGVKKTGSLQGDFIFNTRTGSSTSAERLRITSGGSVLINTTVDTEASADGNDLIIGSTSNTHAGLSIVGSTSGGIGNIFFSDGASYKNQGIIQYRHADDYMAFTVGQYEALRITDDGELRINFTRGTNNVPAKLRLHCGDASISADQSIGEIIFAGRDSGGTNMSRTGALIKATAAANWDTGQTNGYAATHLDFFTQNNSGTDTVAAGARLRIDKDGNLLLGTTTLGHSSADDLTIYNSGHGGITIRTGTTSNGAIFFADGTSGDARFDGYVQYNHGSSPYMIFGTAGDQRLRIDSSGQMGLGVAPNANWPSNADFRALQIGTGACVFGRGSGDEDRGGIAVNWYSDGSNNKYLGNGNAARIYLADGNIYFSTAGANSSGANAAMTLNDRMILNSSGKLGIGFNFNYTMNSNSTNLVIGDGGGGKGITIWTAAGADNQTISFQTNENLSRAEGEISYGPTNTSTAADRNAMMFRTNSSERLRINSGGILTQSASGGDNQFISKRTGSTYSNGDYFFYLFAQNNGGNNMGGIGIVRDTANDNSRLMFSTAKSGTLTEALRIDQNRSIRHMGTAGYWQITVIHNGSGSGNWYSGSAPQQIYPNYIDNRTGYAEFIFEFHPSTSYSGWEEPTFVICGGNGGIKTGGTIELNMNSRTNSPNNATFRSYHGQFSWQIYNDGDGDVTGGQREINRNVEHRSSYWFDPSTQSIDYIHVYHSNYNTNAEPLINQRSFIKIKMNHSSNTSYGVQGHPFVCRFVTYSQGDQNWFAYMQYN